MSEQISASIVVFTQPDTSDGAKLSLGAGRILTQARQITAGDVVALSPAGVAEDEFGRYGVNQIFYYDQPFEQSWQVGVVLADVMAAAVAKANPAGVFLPSSAWGKDAVAHLAMRLGSGGSVDVTNLGVEDGQIVASKLVLGGTWQTKFFIRSGIPVIGIRTAGLEAEEVTNPTSPTSETLAVELSAGAKRIKVVENKRSSNLSNLAEAPVVVCGGRGTGGDFSLVNQLAEKLGGAVGATRVACEEGWIERAAQVGQSGISIAPSLYIGLGISGDQHHVAGIRGAKTIVAVTDDSEAPIFDLCDFGVVGDYTEVVTQALENL